MGEKKKKDILWLERQNLQANTTWSDLSQDSIKVWSQQDSSQVIYLKTASSAPISPHFSASQERGQRSLQLWDQLWGAREVPLWFSEGKSLGGVGGWLDLQQKFSTDTRF